MASRISSRMITRWRWPLAGTAGSPQTGEGRAPIGSRRGAAEGRVRSGRGRRRRSVTGSARRRLALSGRATRAAAALVLPRGRGRFLVFVYFGRGVVRHVAQYPRLQRALEVHLVGVRAAPPGKVVGGHKLPSVVAQAADGVPRCSPRDPTAETWSAVGNRARERCGSGSERPSGLLDAGGPRGLTLRRGHRSGQSVQPDQSRGPVGGAGARLHRP